MATTISNQRPLVATDPLNQHYAFLEAVRDDRPAPVSIASGVYDLRAVFAVYESARTGRAVDVL